MNLRTLAMATALVCAGAPAFAWSQTTTNTVTGNGQIVDPGGLGQQQGQRQRQTATGGASSATGGAAAATIGAGAGAATIAPGAVQAGGNNVNFQANDRVPFSYGMGYPGGARCPGTGPNGAGGGLIAIALGYTQYSNDCAAIERAEFYRSIGDAQMGAALLRHHFTEDQEVWVSLHPITPVSAPSPVAPVSTAPTDSGQAIDLCAARPGWSKSQLAARYPAECHS